MRINKFIAQSTTLSRRAVDEAINSQRVTVNGQPAKLGQEVSDQDQVTLDGKALHLSANATTIVFHKPRGYVVSRAGQGSRTIYELLPKEYEQLQPVGRLDKDSSGLLLLTTDGQLAYELTHPKFEKIKVYEIALHKALGATDQQLITDTGVILDDGLSKLELTPLDSQGLRWQVTMHEGRNRQIRRTFAARGYEITTLHRISFGQYQLGSLPSGQYQLIRNH
jgi:23S rRNA pseudouridine2605 synthase